MRDIALAAAIGLTLAAVACAGSDNQETNDSSRAKFHWKVYDVDGKTVKEKTGTKTFRKRGDWLYNGVHRSKYSWKMEGGILYVDHHYYGNRWTLRKAGDKSYVGAYTGKKEMKSGWTCRMTPINEQEWKDWVSFERVKRSRPTTSKPKPRSRKTKNASTDDHPRPNRTYDTALNPRSIRGDAQQNKAARRVSHRIVNVRNRGRILRGRWVDPIRTRGRWLQVTLRVVNHSRRPITYVPFHLVDKRGRVYSRMTRAALYIKATQPFEYQPGVPTRRTLIFEVASDARLDHIEIRGVAF